MRQILIDVPVREPILEQLKALPDVRVVLADPITTEPCVWPTNLLCETNLLFCSHPPANHEEMKNLEWIQLWSSGFDHILEMNFPARKVRVTNAQGVFDVPIAEWCVSMMINLTRDLRGMIQNQEQGIWDRDARFQRELRGLTVGFWGYGGLARETARLCKTLGLKIHVLSRGEIKCRPKSYVVPGTGDPDGILPDILFPMEKKMEFLSGLDFLVLATPLDSTTRGMVGEAELKALPRKAYLLNPARGPLIQEPALLRALKERWFAGAALDTHFAYPMPPDHPLWQFPNVIMTPHISGSSLSPHFLTRVWDIFQQNVIHFLRNEPLLNEVSLKQLSP